MAKSESFSGFLNVHKDSGMTAHDVVQKLRKLCAVKQIGHAGTLDPMARGVLPVAIGRACRLLRFLQDDKVYLASVLFGQRTDTDDVEGSVIETSTSLPAIADIEKALESFTGDIEQLPPLYSAIHVNGKRLYELARKGESPEEIPKRNVSVYSIELLNYSLQTDSSQCSARLDLRIHCSSGTYIRSIARDLGSRLGSAACLAALKREKAGPFHLQGSMTLAQLAEHKESGTLCACLQSPEDCLGLPRIDLSSELCSRLVKGQWISVPADRFAPAASGGSGLYHKSKDTIDLYVLALYQGRLVAVCRAGGEKTAQFSEQAGSSIVELRPEVVVVDGSTL